jgi:4-hydroxy-3-methylbut-2-enyl diphosphate reductase
VQVIPITPRGYCPGVVKAIHIVNEAIANPLLPRPIYILGMIVHNRFVVDHFTQKGVITLNDPHKSRLELLEDITQGSVIITAHGTLPEVFNKIRAKGLHLIDATCKDVAKTHDLIKDYLNKGYHVLFVGKQGHPESEGALGIGENIHLIETIADIDQLPRIDANIFVTNQTTLSIRDLEKIFHHITLVYPQAIINDEICNSTRIRQEAVLKSNHDVDLCIVVGDPHSNNTTNLAKLSLNHTSTPTYMIESVLDIQTAWLKGVQKVSVTSGASTPTEITAAVIQFLQNYQE